MPAEAFALALGAAALHAAWNLLLARARDVRAATAVALAVAVVAFAPPAAATWDVERAALPWIAASAALELVYFVLLAAAYSRSEVSLVYPVARGAAPVLVLLGGTAAGATLAAAQALGVVLVGAGVLLVRGVRGRADARGLAFALAIAATIAGYTLVDKEGIEHAAPLPYLELVLAPVALAALGSYGWAHGLAALRSGLTLSAAAAGALSFAAYGLALAALALAPAASVAAVREAGILLVAAAGTLVLGERGGAVRLAGAALVLAGVALVGAG